MQVILGEEVAASKLTLFDITKQICDAVQARAEQGTNLLLDFHKVCWLLVGNANQAFVTDKYHGVILLPEGLIESIPEVYALLKVLAHLTALLKLLCWWSFNLANPSCLQKEVAKSSYCSVLRISSDEC